MRRTGKGSANSLAPHLNHDGKCIRRQLHIQERTAMDGRLEKVPTSELKVGLYIERLDRPWTDTPFLFQGFFIHDQDEIEALRRHCEHVYVDSWRSLDGQGSSAEIA